MGERVGDGRVAAIREALFELLTLLGLSDPAATVARMEARGVLPVAVHARRSDVCALMLPSLNAPEAAVVGGVGTRSGMYSSSGPDG